MTMQLIYNAHMRYKREIVQALKELKPPTRGELSFQRIEQVLKAHKTLVGTGYSLQVIEDDKMVGCILASSEKRIWYQRAQCYLYLFLSRKGNNIFKMMKYFVDWVNKYPHISVVRVATETILDSRLLGITRRYPLKHAIWM